MQFNRFSQTSTRSSASPLSLSLYLFRLYCWRVSHKFLASFFFLALPQKQQIFFNLHFFPYFILTFNAPFLSCDNNINKSSFCCKFQVRLTVPCRAHHHHHRPNDRPLADRFYRQLQLLTRKCLSLPFQAINK